MRRETARGKLKDREQSQVLGVGRDVCTKQKQTVCIKCLVRFVTVIKMKHHGETEYLVAPVG